MRIPITKPLFDEIEREYLLKPLESGWLVQGPFVAEFEKLFADFIKAPFARAATSCTTALHLCLEALGISRGDKVIVPSFTYVASANSVEYTGAEVVFCDIDLRTFNIDINKLEALLVKDKKNQIKAIMPVNLFGLCAELNDVLILAGKYNKLVIEDSACGFGAYIGEKHSGTFGDAGAFSFHPRKSITTGEGGMVVTSNREIADRVSSLRDHGAGKSDLQRHKERGGSLLPDFDMRGYNYRMTDLQGALGVSQMKKARKILSLRSKIADRYYGALSGFDTLITPRVPEGFTHGFQSFVCLFSGGDDLSRLTFDRINDLNKKRNRYMNELETRGIATRQGTHAVHTLGYYKKKYNTADRDFLMSYAADRLSLTLPLYAEMTDDEFEYTVSNIKEVMG